MEPFEVQQDTHQVPTAHYKYPQGQMGAYPPQPQGLPPNGSNSGLDLAPHTPNGSLSLFPNTDGRDTMVGANPCAPLSSNLRLSRYMPTPTPTMGHTVETHPFYDTDDRIRDSYNHNKYPDMNGDRLSPSMAAPGSVTGYPAGKDLHNGSEGRIPMSSYRPAAYPPMPIKGDDSPDMAIADHQPATCQMNEQWWCLIFCWLTIPSFVASFLPLCRAHPRFPNKNYKRGWMCNVIAASLLTIIWIIAIAVGASNAAKSHGNGSGSGVAVGGSGVRGSGASGVTGAGVAGGGAQQAVGSGGSSFGGGGSTTSSSGGGTAGCVYSELAEGSICSDGSGFIGASFSDGTSFSSGNRKLLFEVLLERAASALAGPAS